MKKVQKAKAGVPLLQPFSELVRLLSHPDQWKRIAAAQSLGLRKDRTAIKPLVEKLNDPSPEVRLRILEVLGLLAKKGLPEIVNSLGDRNELVRIQAIQALEQIGDPAVKRKLWGCLNDIAGLVRSYAAGAIGRLGDRKDLSKLRLTLHKERSPFARIGLLEALHNLGDDRQTTELLSLCRHSNYRVRCAAANALGSLTLKPLTANEVVKELKQLIRVDTSVAARESFLRAIKQIAS